MIELVFQEINKGHIVSHTKAGTIGHRTGYAMHIPSNTLAAIRIAAFDKINRAKDMHCKTINRLNQRKLEAHRCNLKHGIADKCIAVANERAGFQRLDNAFSVGEIFAGKVSNLTKNLQLYTLQ